jgi:O-succinylbenzoate synthase
MATRYLLPRLLQTDWSAPEEAATAWSAIRGNNFAKAGVDAAVWVLYSQSRGSSLATALGGTRTEVSAGVSLGIEASVDALLDEVAKHVDAGYRRVKLKIRPGWDVDPVRAVRNSHPDLDVHVDANGVYTESSEHLTTLGALDEFGLTMIEQPFAPRDLLAHARLQARVSTPVCLDESIETVDDLQTALHLDAARVINIKVSRMGGLTTARAAHDIAYAARIPVWCGGMHEFGVGRAANLALSSLPGFSLPSDVSGSAKYYARDITTEPIVADDGRVTVPTGTGLGFTVDEGFVDANSTAEETLTA